MENHVTKARFARMANVEPREITAASHVGGCLHEATVGQGPKQRINADHPVALAYIQKHSVGKKLTGVRAVYEARKKEGPSMSSSAIPEEMQAFAEMTIREVVEKFGTDHRMVDYLRALKEIETIDATRVKNAKARGELIHKDLVLQGIIEPIDASYRKMLTDGAKTIARRAVAMVGSGMDVDEIEKFVCDQLGSFIRPTKAKIQKVISDG